jgi:hypothetical protein
MLSYGVMTQYCPGLQDSTNVGTVRRGGRPQGYGKLKSGHGQLEMDANVL